MTYGKTMRERLMLSALGMSLFCAGASKAQEIVNTNFDDGPNGAALAQRAAPNANAATVTASQPMMPSTQLHAAAEPVTILDFDAWREQTFANMLVVEKRYPPPLLSVVPNWQRVFSEESS